MNDHHYASLSLLMHIKVPKRQREPAYHFTGYNKPVYPSNWVGNKEYGCETVPVRSNRTVGNEMNSVRSGQMTGHEAVSVRFGQMTGHEAVSVRSGQMVAVPVKSDFEAEWNEPTRPVVFRFVKI